MTIENRVKSVNKIKMVPLVERAVFLKLPEKMGLLFDVWSDGSVHYVVIFETYCEGGEYQETLISFSPLLQEDGMGDKKHLSFIKESFGV